MPDSNTQDVIEQLKADDVNRPKENLVSTLKYNQRAFEINETKVCLCQYVTKITCRLFSKNNLLIEESTMDACNYKCYLTLRKGPTFVFEN